MADSPLKTARSTAAGCLDPALEAAYDGAMAEEVSKRIDDVHRRFDDLRADMVARFTAVDKRLDDMNQSLTTRLDDMNQSLTRRLDDMNQTLRTFMWVVSGWFTFLTAVLAVFGFLRR